MVWLVNATFRLFTPGKKTPYPLYRKLGGPQDRAGQVWKISFPPEFVPRTVQPVACRYTECAVQPTHVTATYNNPCGLFAVRTIIKPCRYESIYELLH